MKSKEILDYVEIANQVVKEINNVRTNPFNYVRKLQDCLKFFRGNVFSKPGEESMRTTEGSAAFEEAISFLKSRTALRGLNNDDILRNASKDHVLDIGSKGLTSHEGSDGSSVVERIEKYGEWDGACCENIDFGMKLPEDIVISLIVDDGLPNRPQRSNLFSPEFKYIGVSSGPHKDFGILTVITLSAGVRNFGEEAQDYSSYIEQKIKKTGSKDDPKNLFQEDDKDAPDDTVSVRISKATKNIDDTTVKRITRKIYTLRDNTYHIVEIEED
jgi:uncharacterized protein YkwD